MHSFETSITYNPSELFLTDVVSLCSVEFALIELGRQHCDPGFTTLWGHSVAALTICLTCRSGEC